MKKAILALLALFAAVSYAQSAQMNKIAAVVNGQPITMYDLQKEAIPDLIKAGINPNDTARADDIKKIFKNSLDVMIMDILVAQEAKRLKATVTDSEVENSLNRMMKERGLNKKQMEAQLARQKLTVDKLRETIKKNLTRQKVMTMEVGRRVVVTPDEIKDYYEKNKDKLFNRDGLHMGLLVYHPKAPAASVAAQIKSGKISFEEACAKYSIAPNRDKGGDAGPVEWERLNPEWDGRLNNMRPGDVTDIFTLQGHKAQVRLFRPGGGEEKPLTLEQARPQIDAILRQPKAKGRFEEYAKQLRKKAVIDIRI